MDTLNAYTFREFIALAEEERDLYKAFGLKCKPHSWGKGDPQEWEWAVIKQLQDLLNKPYLTYDDMIEIISLASKEANENILKKLWFDCFKFYNFVVEAIIEINELEKNLNYEPTAQEVNAGIEEYQKFGWLVTIHRLAGGDILKHDAVGKQKFCDVFAVLLLNKQDAEFNRRLLKQKPNV